MAQGAAFRLQFKGFQRQPVHAEQINLVGIIRPGIPCRDGIAYPVRFKQYTVAAEGDEILGFSWNEMTGDEAADCEIIALYVRYAKRNSGIGRALFQHSIEVFRAAGKKRMIVWCLKENAEARKFYEKMGGKADKTGTHPWGDRDYDMISYLYPLDE